MKLRHYLFGGMIGMASGGLLVGQQTPVLGSIEAPYAAIQTTVHVAGGVYGPGSVAYGPVGTYLVLSGAAFGGSGTVQFIGYKNGAVDPNTTVTATVTLWTTTMLFLRIPSGAVTGLVKVTSGGHTSNGLPFIVTPGSYSGSCPAYPSSGQLQITTSALSNGTVGHAYSATLSATGGTQAYTWAITSGSLPTGLSLNASTGVISGTPSSIASPVSLTVQVTDSSSPVHLTDTTILSLTIASQTLVVSRIYTYSAGYDSAGNVTSHSDSTYNGGSIMGAWTFTYDTLNRLVTGTATAGPFSGQYACWNYDTFGNRTSEALSSTQCSSNPPLLSWATYNTSKTNRMDTDSASTLYGANPTYDGAGELTQDGANTYRYDGEGRVCAVERTPVTGYTTRTGYIYNAEGVRVGKGTLSLSGSLSCDVSLNGFQLTQSYVLGPGGQELTMLDGNRNWHLTNVYAGGMLAGTYDSSGLHLHISDPLGSRRMQVSGNMATAGQPETEFQSMPYGNLLGTSTDPGAPYDPDNPFIADDSSPLHFTGKERDTESGNDYFGARYYASSMGRWLSPDWSAKMEPVPYAKLDNPQSLNLYAYVSNNPLIHIDADGHLGCKGSTEGFCNPAVQENLRKGMDSFSALNAAQQNAASSGSTDGTPFKAIQTGGTTVTGTFDPYGDIGVTIHATPSNCSDCQWIQQGLESGPGNNPSDYGHKPFIDGQDVMGNVPLMPRGGCGSNCLDDQPSRPSSPRPLTWSAVAVFGHANEANHTFKAMGAIRYGFSINSNGALKTFGPVAAPSQMRGVINQASHEYSGWSIQ